MLHEDDVQEVLLDVLEKVPEVLPRGLAEHGRDVLQKVVHLHLDFVLPTIRSVIST